MSDTRPGSVRRSLNAARPKLGRLCHYCGEISDSIDHIVPYSIGRCSTLEVLVAACRSCNSRKGTKRSQCDCEKCTKAWNLFDLADENPVIFRKLIRANRSLNE